jgi:hypothetical protein
LERRQEYEKAIALAELSQEELSTMMRDDLRFCFRRRRANGIGETDVEDEDETNGEARVEERLQAEEGEEGTRLGLIAVKYDVLEVDADLDQLRAGRGQVADIVAPTKVLRVRLEVVESDDAVRPVVWKVTCLRKDQEAEEIVGKVHFLQTTAVQVQLLRGVLKERYVHRRGHE